MKQIKSEKIGVILMTYGSPRTLKDVPVYLQNVHGGKPVDSELTNEFRRRYKVIGGSPLVRITKQQAKALEKELNKSATNKQFIVRAGMRFSDPFIRDVVASMAKKVSKIIGIIMSPQYSPIIMSGYKRTLEEAIKPYSHITLSMIEAWHNEPDFIEAIAEKVVKAIAKLPGTAQQTTPILFSAHSMPKRVIDREPDYINQLHETAAKVAKKAGLRKTRWLFCYQSAGHTPEEWLKPDFADIMPELEKAGKKHVIIAPIQFLADHLEILYDVNIGAREQAEEHGITFAKIDSLNTSPLFIKALAAVVQKHKL